MVQSQTYPKFFKPFMPQRSSQRLLIPTAFIEAIDKVVPNQVILRNRLGRIWLVEVVTTDSGVYFQNGWENFVDDNSLELGEFIVFHYDGDCKFYVNIFDKSGCEKKCTTAFASIEKKISFIKKEDEGNYSEKVIEEDEVDVDNNNDDDDDDDEEEEEGEEEEGEEKAKAYGRGHRNKGLLHSMDCKATADVNIKGEKERIPSAKVKNCNRIDVGRYVQPTNPYFVTRVLSGKRGKVYVPTDLLTDFNIQLHRKMILRDQYGRKWPGKVVVWKDGRSWIGGWSRFCKWNNVTKQDVCICEFMLGRDCMGNLIQVHIVRGRTGAR